MGAGAGDSSGPPSRSVRFDDTVRRCPDAPYSISEAVCLERQRRKYHECTDCSWSEANAQKRAQQADAQRLLHRYGF